MKIRDVMTPDVRTINPDATIREAARLMAEADVGALPVASGDRLAGMVTDRDIVIRGVAIGKGVDATVGEVMSHEVLYCREDDDVADVCENMSDIQVRRLPVVNADKRLVGIVSLADIADSADSEEAGEALEAITRPGGQHNQSMDGRA
ncbi:MAG TPA: CBS domain-containing protein [Vitreimonas sp.]|uniref:CBS domain-containing protein n=1 Tax=Vitreimonas sp. TaxID=3069702 RepID=UPI002D34ABC2|nr:CBS domain-containing protein [Vitreimonas sp.]HYD87485.1 CBS domain-containing protein [Vitreimonas sp.]